MAHLETCHLGRLMLIGTKALFHRGLGDRKNMLTQGNSQWGSMVMRALGQEKRTDQREDPALGIALDRDRDQHLARGLQCLVLVYCAHQVLVEDHLHLHHHLVTAQQGNGLGKAQEVHNSWMDGIEVLQMIVKLTLGAGKWMDGIPTILFHITSERLVEDNLD